MPMATTQEVGLYTCGTEGAQKLRWPQGSFLQLTSRRHHKASTQGVEKRVEAHMLLTLQHTFPTGRKSTTLIIAQTEGRYRA